MKKLSEGFSTAQVGVGTTPVKISSGEAGIDKVTIQNLGTTQVFIGPTSSVSTTNGFLIPGTVGASVTLDGAEGTGRNRPLVKSKQATNERRV